MRRLFVLLCLVFGCSDSQLDAGAFNGDDGDDSGSAPAECHVASDCALAAAKCCDCPTYAAPKTDPEIQACSGVMCPTMTCPDNVGVACNAGHCELACAPMACVQTCADGFALDANGCLTCECAAVTTRACLADPDCTEAPADCCGCAKGGVDTAVPASQLSDYLSDLGCPAQPSCPGTNSCDPAEGPTCVQGACRLAAPLPITACGRPDLAVCADAYGCVVNADPVATAHAVGNCQPPP